MKELSEIYAEMHKRREDWIDERRRARSHQEKLFDVLALTREHAERYSRGSVTRVALDNLALEIETRL